MEKLEHWTNDFLYNSFSVSNTLTGMYLWLIFGFLSNYINCDLQRFLQNNPFILHLVGLNAFFFLFTSVDEKNETGLLLTWIKTIIFYFIFILATKSKWYFIISVLFLFFIDRSLEYYVRHDLQDWESEDKEEFMKWKRIASHITVGSAIALIFIGAIHYVYLQKLEYKDEFSIMKFLFSKSKKNCMTGERILSYKELKKNKN